MRHGRIVIMVLFLALLAGADAWAGATWQAHQTLRFDNAPLDMLPDYRANRVYVLNDAGEILIYGFNGIMKGRIDVGNDVIGIKAGPNDDMLYLLRKADKSIQSISISVTEEIDITGSPFKGEKDAPVTIAVFSDFQ
jgi:hypothetical protein